MRKEEKRLGETHKETLRMTRQHYDMLNEILPAMYLFYNGNLVDILKEVAKGYGVDEKEAEKAASYVDALKITAPNENMAANTKKVLAVLRNHAECRDTSQVLCWEVPVEPGDIQALVKVLDTYFRIMMGQFSVIFNVLDIKTDNEHALQAWRDANYDGGCGMKEIRDRLIPNLKTVGWNGGYGISNREIPENGRLAYELCRVLEKSRSILRVTEVPLPKIA